MRTLQKAKGRRESGAFLAVPFAVINSDNYQKLSAKAAKLLWDVAAQIRVKQGGPVNNGDLAITISMMNERGWKKSRSSLYMARDELIHYGFIKQTRSGSFGGRKSPALYALTFFAINESEKHCEATRVAPNDWKQSKPKWKLPKRQKLNSLYRKSAVVVPIIGTEHFKQRFLGNEMAIN